MGPTSSALADQDGKPDAADSSGIVNPENSTSAQQQDKQSFPFMKLPLELRIKVYEEHLLKQGTIVVKGALGFGNREVQICPGYQCRHDYIKTHETFDATVLNLWTVSKATLQESLPLFFRFNRFHFTSVDELLNFLSCIGPTSRRNILSISFTYEGGAPAQAMRSLRQCVGLRQLTIQISTMTYFIIPYDDRRRNSSQLKVWGMNDLLKIRGITELEVFERTASYPYHCRFTEQIPAFEKTLQILKQPHKAAQLTRQMNKDYPQSKAKPVRGKTNVTTRTEAKLAASETPTSH